MQVNSNRISRTRSLVVVMLALVLCVPALAAVAQSDPVFGVHVVRQSAPLIGEDGEAEVGYVEFWNTRENFISEIWTAEGWMLTDVQIYVGEEPAPTKKDNPLPGKFPCKEEFGGERDRAMVACHLKDLLDLSWGGDQLRHIAIHGDLVMFDDEGEVAAEESFWAVPAASSAFANSVREVFALGKNGTQFTMPFVHPRRGHFIDSPVGGLSYVTPTHSGITDASGAFDYFPGEEVELGVGTVYLGSAVAALKISPLDIFMSGIDVDPEDGVHDERVVNMARLIQSLDVDGVPAGGIDVTETVKGCLDMAAEELLLLDVGTGVTLVDFESNDQVQALIEKTHEHCSGAPDVSLVEVDAAEAAANLEAGLNASGIFRKNISKEADYGVTKIKLDIMPVYVPGMMSNGDLSVCVEGGDLTTNDDDDLGVPYEEWRLGGDPAAESCDPRIDPENCLLTMIECREVAKPIVSAYMQKVDLEASHVTTNFDDDRFAHDIFVSLSRDDGTTWKRTNVSRMGDLTSFDLDTGEPFPGTSRSPAMKVVDNNVLAAWTSSYCKSGTPRYSITTCDDPDTEAIETPETGCQLVCRGNPDEGTEVCEPDYPFDDEFFVEDIWGVSGQQRSVDYDEVDDVADLGIGEIPYSCLWTARGTVVTQAELNNGTFDSLLVDDDTATEEDETVTIGLGDVVWFKPERLTSGRRDAFFPIVQGTRGAGFSIVWQEDPEGLRPGKGKGPGVGWSGAISNHQTDIWYSFIEMADFQAVDENFIPGGPPEGEGPEDTPGFGRPKAFVPFSLPTPVSDNNMINTDTLKVELDGSGFPIVVNGTFVPMETVLSGEGLEIEGDGTTSYAYRARDVEAYAYYTDRGGTLDLCDISGANDVLETLGSGDPETDRWYQFWNNAGSGDDAEEGEEPALKTVCISSDGRLLDGDVGASRPNMSIQKGTDGKAYILLAYEESKGMGDGHETEGGEQVEQSFKPDYGKNLIYHSFEFTQPDLAAPGHILNLPATCGEHQVYHIDPETSEVVDDLQCTLEEPIPITFPDTVDADGAVVANETFMQYRTEVARRVRFIAQSESKAAASEEGVAALTIYKQGLEGQGRPADVYIRRIIPGLSDNPNPYAFENFECGVPMADLDFDYSQNQNVWGMPYGDPLCWSGGEAGTDPVGARGHYNLTSSHYDLAVDAGPDDDTPDDPTDDMYGTEKVLLWHQEANNIDDESFENYYSNSRSHRGFIRGDYVVIGFSYSPNWAAARNGRDRYNFYVRRSFTGGRDWTTTPGGAGVYVCPEFRTDPATPDPDGSGNLPPAVEGFDATCGDEVDGWAGDLPPLPAGIAMIPFDAALGDASGVKAVHIPEGAFEPARNVSMIMNNHETDLDPRIAATPPVTPLDGTVTWQKPNGVFALVSSASDLSTYGDHAEDEYIDSAYFVAWGTGDNATSTGGTTITPEATPLDLYYTRSTDWGDSYLMLPWNVNPQGGSDNWEQGELVWRYDFLAHGDPEQGEAQLRSTADGSKMYGIYHEQTGVEDDSDGELTRWYPWEPEFSHDNDVWFRRIIFWPEEVSTP